MTIHDVVTKAEALLQGEPLRAIVYGAAVVVYIVAAVTGRFGVVSLDNALVQAGAAAAALTELGRHYVYSPATVTSIVDELAPLDEAIAPAIGG